MSDLTMCQSCMQATDARLSHCTVCAFPLKHAGFQAPVFSIPLAPKRKLAVRVHLIALIDRSGSSAKFAKGIGTTADSIFLDVEKKAADVIVTVQSHGDLEFGQEEILVIDRGTPKEAQAALRTISFGGGGDEPETHMDAIEKMLETVPIETNPQHCRSVMLFFGTADSKPARSGRTPSQIGRSLADLGLLTYVVWEPDVSAIQQFVAASNAMFLEINNNPSASLLASVSARIGASIAASVATGSTEPL